MSKRSSEPRWRSTTVLAVRHGHAPAEAGRALAFAVEQLLDVRQLGLPDDAEHVNPNGGAIALGHPLGMSGTRLALTAILELEQRKAKRALCTMCIGVGQGISVALERAGRMVKPGGRLVYEGLRTCMGYRVAYDPSLPWLLAASLLAAIALAWHYALRLRQPAPGAARAVQGALHG